MSISHWGIILFRSFLVIEGPTCKSVLEPISWEEWLEETDHK